MHNAFAGAPAIMLTLPTAFAQGAAVMASRPTDRGPRDAAR